MYRIPAAIMILLFSLHALHSYTQSQKMSSFVRQAYMEQVAAERTGLRAKSAVLQERCMPVLVKTSDREALRLNGCRILAEFSEDLLAVSVPTARLGELASLESVRRIEAGRPCEATNNDAAAITGAADLRSMPPQGYTGKGVVVGVTDIAFDLTHPTFWKADGGEYRIKRFWDMLDQTQGGLPVTGVDTTYVGRQYVTESEILVKGCSADGKIAATGGHGTHTAGTAAGSGRNADGTISDYAGMAPEADICLVSNATSHARQVVPEEDLYKYNTTLDGLGFKYIFDYAKSVGKPCVVSFSEGAAQELEGENMLFNEMLESLQGQGRIFVASAGNEGDKLTYVNKPVGMAKAGAFVSPSATSAYYNLRSSDKMTLRITYYPASAPVVVKEYSTDEILACEKSILADTIDIGDTREVVLLNAYPNEYDPSTWAAEMYLTTVGSAVTIGRDIPISITLLGGDISAEAFARNGYFTTNTSLDATLNAAVSSHSVIFPGALKAAICVGATVKDSPCAIANYSGRGPALSGITKPDVVAPGSNIMSAKSKACYGSYGWMTKNGSSMSTPVVSGIIALWLEAFPTLTRKQALEAIAATATQPDASLDYPNNTYGNGLIDAEAGLQYILDNFTGVKPPSVSPEGESSTSLYNLHGMKIKTPTKGIYIKDGKKVIF